MFGLLKKAELLDESSILWMFDSFAWALRHFDANMFYQQTILVTPTNACFPGRGESTGALAQLILRQVTQFAGLSHWPFRLLDEDGFAGLPLAQVTLTQIQRGNTVLLTEPVTSGEGLPVLYSPEVMRDPQVVIANFAHSVAHYLGTTAAEAPPGGAENWPHVTELLAVFLGFGLMMANSAHTEKIRSCASCSGPAVERTNYLSQYDVTYALAIFTAMKGLNQSQVLPHLKYSLRAFFKKAYKDVRQRKDRLLSLPGRAALV